MTTTVDSYPGTGEHQASLAQRFQHVASAVYHFFEQTTSSRPADILEGKGVSPSDAAVSTTPAAPWSNPDAY
jgi:hypothetical protein